jgi:hypothetical protein
MHRQMVKVLFPLLVAVSSLPPFALAQRPDRSIAITPGEGYDLGQVGHEDRILGVAEIANQSPKSLTIRSIRSNCACYTVSAFAARTLLPGESTAVEFDLTFPRGKQLHNPVIYLLTDHKEEPMRYIVMKMSLITAEASSSPRPGHFQSGSNSPRCQTSDGHAPHWAIRLPAGGTLRFPQMRRFL